MVEEYQKNIPKVLDTQGFDAMIQRRGFQSRPPLEVYIFWLRLWGKKSNFFLPRNIISIDQMNEYS